LEEKIMKFMKLFLTLAGILNGACLWAGNVSSAAICASSDRPNDLHIFGVGADNQMWHQMWNGFAWTNWEGLGGVFTSTPAAATWGQDRMDVFAVGADKQMYHKGWSGDGLANSTWSPSQTGWDALGGVFAGAPAVASWGQNRLDVFAIGMNTEMYHASYDGNQWSPWESIGGGFTSTPAVVSWGAGRLDVFALGLNQQMYHKAWSGGWLPNQTDWEPLGGVFLSAPAVTSWGPDRLDIFAIGTDHQMYHQAWGGSGWLPGALAWDKLGGSFGSAPAVTSWGPNRLDVVGLDNNNQMFHKAWTGSAWSPAGAGWEAEGGTFTSAPAITSWSANRMDVVGLGTNFGVYHKASNSAGVLPAQAQWDNLNGVFRLPPQSTGLVNPFYGASATTDMVIIAPDEFMAALKPLVDHKNATGATTIAVSISSLSPFFQGVDDQETIKNAIRYAHESMATIFVMLAGDATKVPVRYQFMHGLSSYYANNYNATTQLSDGNWSVPATFPNAFADKLSPTGFAYGTQPNLSVPIDGTYIPSDLYYANLYHHPLPANGSTIGYYDTWDANGNGLYNEGTWLDTTNPNPDNVDGFPDVAVGRVTAHTAADITAFVYKIIQYENAPPPFAGTFVADYLYPGATSLSDSIISGSAQLWATNAPVRAEINLPSGSTPAANWASAQNSVVASSVGQSSWVSYLGHGWSQGWDGGFDASFVGQTSGSSLPVVFAIGCSTGQFMIGGPFNGLYMDVSGTQHNFQVSPGGEPCGNQAVLVDAISGQLYGGVDVIGANALPLTTPRPDPYDGIGRGDQGFAYAWLMSNKFNGAIAYFGETGVAEDWMGQELETYLLQFYGTARTVSQTAGGNPTLGTAYLVAQQAYFNNHQSDNGSTDYHSIARFYLGWMTFFGDPSLRLPVR
jgi:hypothetical protein